MADRPIVAGDRVVVKLTGERGVVVETGPDAFAGYYAIVDLDNGPRRAFLRMEVRHA